jgi:hypothetical protein
MLILRNEWNMRQWYDWLREEMDLEIGRDYRWAWAENHWAIEFLDPRVETMVRLKVDIRD